MSRSTLIALLLGLLLVAAPVSRVFAEDTDEYEGDDDDEEAAAPTDESEKDVLVMTAANFDDTIKKHKFVLAEFYAPWCGHCKTLAPHYAKAATILKDHDADVVLGKVDATVETDLAQKFGVSGYPTLKWFVDGEPQEYKGPRETEGIVAWIKKKTGPVTVVVDDAAKLKELEEEHPAIAVAYDLKSGDLEVFKNVAQKVEDVFFVETSNKDVAKAAGLSKAGHIAMIKNFKGEDRATADFSGKSVSAESLNEWVNGEKIPLTLEFNEENSDKIFNSGIKQQVILWAAPSDIVPGSKVFDTLKKVASENKGKLIFVVVNNEGPNHEPVTNFFGLKDATAPAVVGFFMEGNKKYKMSGEFNEKNLKDFAAGVLDGTANVEYKSQPIPEDNKDGDVTVVVGKTVDSIVFDDKRDVLLEVYAPWCGHCKKLEPVYKKLAKRFKKVDSVVIAKMDGTENEHPDLEIRGFPTIVFVPAGGKEVITFDESDRSLKSLTKFIKKHAKVPYELPKKEGGKGGDEDTTSEEHASKDEL